MKRKLLYLAFGAYSLLMLWLLLGRRMGIPNPLHNGYWQAVRGNLNLIPFRTIGDMARLLGTSDRPFLLRFAVINLGGNVGMFVPLGVFLPAVWKRQRKFGRFLWTVAAVILAVELLQLFTLLGSGDVDDLILNLLGASIGWWMWHCCAKPRAGC